MKPKSPTTIKKSIVKLSLPKPLQEIHKWLNNSKGKPTSYVRKKNTILFYGTKTSGKHTIATMIAHQARQELYKVDLSKVKSKYIGETEKNLEAIFKLAEDKNWILFLDEADALFGKRSTVSNSHDRYANQEVSYLLQRMEKHDGLTILSTNIKSNIDPAFTRRLRFIVDFPLP